MSTWVKALQISATALVSVLISFLLADHGVFGDRFVLYGGMQGIAALLAFWALVWYTLETEKVRKAAESQAQAAHDQLRALGDQIRLTSEQLSQQIRPVLTLAWGGGVGSDTNVTVHNIGLGPAFNITVQDVPLGDGIVRFTTLSVLAPNQGSFLKATLNEDGVAVNTYLATVFRDSPAIVSVRYDDLGGRHYTQRVRLGLTAEYLNQTME